MKILFINYSPVGPNFNSSIAALSGYLKKFDKEVSIISFQNNAPKNKICNLLSQIKPKIVAFSVYTNQWDTIKYYIQLVKLYSNSIIICGGYHATLCPDEVISQEGVDIVCIGEGEIPLLKLVESIENGTSYNNINGLWVKSQQEESPIIYKNAINPPIKLETLPYLDRNLFLQNNLGSKEYFPTHKGSMPLISGRGCSFNCSFCNNTSLKSLYKKYGYSNYVRKKNVKDVIQECIFLVKKYKVNFFEFWDEEFAYDKNWLNEFCDYYNNNVFVPFCCALRIELATEKILLNLHKAGCIAIAFGIEAGNEEYRKKYLKRYMSNKNIIDIFNITKKIGIARYTFIMIGLPEETSELIHESIQLLKTIKPEVINWSIFQPLPNTELYDLCKKNNYLNGTELIPYNNTFPKYKIETIKQPYMTFQQLNKCISQLKELKQTGIAIHWE